MTQPVEDASERRVLVSYRSEARSTAPCPRCRGIDVAAEDIIPAEIPLHALQIIGGGTACDPQAGDDGVVFDYTIETQQGAEILPCSKVNLCAVVQAVIASVTGRYCTLPVLQRQAGSTGAVQIGVDVDVVLRVQGQFVRAPCHDIVDIDIPAGAARPAGGLDRHITATQVCAKHHPRHVPATGRDGEIHRVDQPCARQAHGGGGGDFGVVGDFDTRRAGFNKAAVTAVRRTGVERTADIHCARRHAAQQGDGAVMVFHRARFDHTGVVHHASQQRIPGAGTHDDQPAVGLDQSAVFGKGIQGAFIHLQMHQAVAAERERGGTAGPQRNGAQFRDDHALVTDRPAEQGHGPAVRGGNSALVDDAGVAAITLECIVAVGEILVRDIQRRSD